MPGAVVLKPKQGPHRIIAFWELMGSPLILIAGGSCSGKSYFAARLKERFAAISKSVGTVQLDYYFKDLDDPTMPRNTEGRKLFDLPGSYHLNEYKLAIGQLINGQAVNMPNYDSMANKRLVGLGLRIEPPDIIIAEGLFAISILSSDHPFAIKIFIDADQQFRLNRRIARDTVRCGVSSEIVRDNFVNKVLSCHMRFVEPQKLEADFVIRSP